MITFVQDRSTLLKAERRCIFRVYRSYGFCEAPGHPFCREHVGAACATCGDQAVGGCLNTGWLSVCGVLFCARHGDDALCYYHAERA